MFYVYFARGYVNQEMIAECRTFDDAVERADQEYDMGSRDVEVYDVDGVVVYDPEIKYTVDLPAYWC